MRVGNGMSWSLFLLIAIIVPLGGTILYLFVPFRLLGKNIWVVIPLVSAALYISKEPLRRLYLGQREMLFLVFVSVFLFVFYSGRYYYDLSPDVLSYRWGFSIFIYALAIRELMKRGFHGVLGKSIVVGSLIISTIIHINRLFYPELSVQYVGQNGDPMIVHYQTRDGLMGAAVTDHLLMPSLVLVLYYYSKRYINLPIAGFVFFFIMIASLYSNTRLVAAFGVVFSLFLLFEVYKQKKRLVLLLLPFLLALVVHYAMILASNPRWTTEGDGGRLLKYKQGVELIFESPTSVLFGEDPLTSLRLVELDGVSFSDNGFLQLGVSFGLVVMFGYLFLLFFLLGKYRIDRHLNLLLFYGASTYLLTNVISWESWTIYFLVTYFVIKKYKVLERRPEQVDMADVRA